MRALRASRSAADTQAALERVERAARDGSNLVPPVLAAVEGRATLGEIADCLRGVFGEHRRPPVSERAAVAPLLDVRHLTVQFGAAALLPPAVDDVSFHVAPGETLGLVGESGSGKSITAFSILRLLPPAGRIIGGEVRFEGRDLLPLDEREMQAVRGARISLIFQEPMTALNPVMRVGEQIAEALYVHGHARATRRASRPWSCSTRCRSRSRAPGRASIRISCPAACGSA